MLLCFGADTKLTPKSNPRDVHEYAPEFQLPVIKRVIEIYNAKLVSIADEVLKSCLFGTESSLSQPHLCRCIAPGEKSVYEFYFNCQRNAAEKGIINSIN